MIPSKDSSKSLIPNSLTHSTTTTHLTASPQQSIVSTYHRLLREDPELTMPVAAIEALVELLAQSQASTISETFDLLERSTAHLKSRVPNPISLSAGTDLFQRYLINALQQQRAGGRGDFRAVRNHLISNGRLFVTRAKASRDKIASFGRHFVRDGNTVLTNGNSRVVGALLKHAAEDTAVGKKGSSVRFRVIYVHPNNHNNSIASASSNAEGQSVVITLRALGVPVATINEGSVAYAMGIVDMVIVGAEGVVENGGIISRLGTYQIGVLAKAARKPFYVVAESHKFVRLYPLSQYDLPIEQDVIRFTAGEDQEEERKKDVEDEGGEGEGKEKEKGEGKKREAHRERNVSKTTTMAIKDANAAVDFTPPDLISALITESGVLTPSAVSEELIRIWF